MFISQLPSELLWSILSHIPRNDLYECMQVCRLWRAQIMPVYYAEITLTTDHGRFLQFTQTELGIQISKFVKTLVFSFEIRKNVKKLSLDKFELLIFNLPHLRVIRFDSRKTKQLIEGYLQYLETIAPRTSLQEVSIPRISSIDWHTDKIYQSHYMVNKYLQHQITTLSLYNTDMLEGGCDQVLEFLAGFENIQHLTLYNIDTYEGAREGIHVTSVLDACNGLQSLKLDNRFSWDISDGHTDHFNLTSISLVLPQLSKDHFAYFLEHVPNLKELTLVIKENTISDVYASLEPSMATRFTTYLNRLDVLEIRARSETCAQDGHLFWRLIQEIHDNKAYGNLWIECTDKDEQMEIIHFDKLKQTFRVRFQWKLIDLNNMLTTPFQFLKFNSIKIYDTVVLVDHETGQVETHNILDLLEHALIDDHVQLHIKIYTQAIIVTPSKSALTNQDSLNRRMARYASLEYLDLNRNVLEKLSTIYTGITSITLLQCKFPKEDDNTNTYIIDLQPFDAIEVLEFDFDVNLVTEKRTRLIYIHCITDQEQKYYYYHKEDVIYAVEAPENIPKSMYVIKIKAKKLQKFVFNRQAVPLGIKCLD